MIKKVESRKDLKRFIYFVKKLYDDDPHYVYPLFFVLYKELKSEVLEKKDYTALLSMDEDGQINGRLMYCFEYNNKQKQKYCYFSYFDSINDKRVAKSLFDYMEADMENEGISQVEGSFTPYDPDNRRGILIDGFDDDPVIFTAYNKPYYQDLLEACGYQKRRDSFSVTPHKDETTGRKLATFARYFEKRFNVDVDMIDFKQIDRDIQDIQTVLKEADNEYIYQETPSTELIRSVAEQLRVFLDRRIIFIARERDTRRPVGFAFCLLDFNQVFKKTKGRIRPLKMLLAKRKINRARGMMQYVVPDYQSTGLIGYIYKKIFDQFSIMNITEFEAGTMMEGNEKTLTSFSKFGGEISKTYRIYGKDISA